MKCKKCLLSELKPNIWLNKEGICNICTDFEKRKDKRGEKALLESELYKIIQEYKGKGKYDCLVMCSGGKDSTSALYFMKKKYHLNPLAFTFDHGFENKEAMENIRNAVDILGVDFLYFKTDLMRKAFKELVESKTKASVCHLCALWYMKITHEMAQRFETPLIVAGWRKEQSQVNSETPKEYLAMSRATADFIKNHLRKIPKYKDFPVSMKEVLKQAHKKMRSIVVSPHWFLEKDPEELIELLEKELKWKAPKMSYPKNSTNCLLNYASVYLSMQDYGFSHYHIEVSKQIREGEVSRQEAEEKLKINFSKKFVNSILKQIGCRI